MFTKSSNKEAPLMSSLLENQRFIGLARCLPSAAALDLFYLPYVEPQITVDQNHRINHNKWKYHYSVVH